MTFILTPIFSDGLNGGNANPLNPANWTQTTGGVTTPLQVLNNVCQGTDVTMFNAEYYSGAATPNNCYASIKIASWVAGQSEELDLAIRATTDLQSGYDLFLLDNGDGTTVTIELSTIAGSGQIIYNNPASPLPVAGDIFTIGAVGTTIFAMKNGVVFASGTDSSFASGLVILSLAYNSIPPTTILTVTNFVMGSAASSGAPTPYSVPDCRNFATFPNTSRTVQGTKIYDVQTGSNHAVPGTDSRVAPNVPTDSRISPNIPQNSRTPGTFGPGQ